MTKLFIANIPYITTDQELADLFSTIGEVHSAKVIVSRGFAFVEMADDEDADRAMARLDDTEWNGRRIFVKLANQ